MVRTETGRDATWAELALCLGALALAWGVAVWAADPDDTTDASPAHVEVVDETRDKAGGFFVGIDIAAKEIHVTWRWGYVDGEGEFQARGQARVTLRNEVDEDGNPVAGQQWWDRLIAGADINGQHTDLRRFLGLVRAAVKQKGDL